MSRIKWKPVISSFFFFFFMHLMKYDSKPQAFFWCSYPQRVSKLKAAVRYMFNNPEDVRWFKVRESICMTNIYICVCVCVETLSTFIMIGFFVWPVFYVGVGYCSLWKCGPNVVVGVALKNLLVHMVWCLL